MLELVGGALAQGWGEDTAGRRFIGGQSWLALLLEVLVQGYFKQAPGIRTASTSNGAITPKIGTGIRLMIDRLDDF